MIKRATSRRLGAEPAHDHVLLGIEQLAPFGVAAGDGKLGFHLRAPAPHLTAPAKNIPWFDLQQGVARDEKTVWTDRTHVDIRVCSLSKLEDGHCAGFGGGAVFGFDFGLAAVRLAPSAPQRT